MHAAGATERKFCTNSSRHPSWIAELLAHGLLRPSFIPPPALQALRDLTRTRVSLVQTRTQAKQRVLKIWEDTNVKVAHVVSELFGVSGRRMLAALMAGERHPQRLATLALGTLRRKLPQLEWALQGQFTEHHTPGVRMALNNQFFDRMGLIRLSVLPLPIDTFQVPSFEPVDNVVLQSSAAIQGETPQAFVTSRKRAA